MIPQKFKDVLEHEGPAAIVTWPAPIAPNDPDITESSMEQRTAATEPHVTATWNSYIHITEDERLLIPAAGMRITEMNANDNNKVKMVFGSKQVEGKHSMGAGFLLVGRANFFEVGEEFDMMKKKYPFLTRVLEITVSELTQTL